MSVIHTVATDPIVWAYVAGMVIGFFAGVIIGQYSAKDDKDKDALTTPSGPQPFRNNHFTFASDNVKQGDIVYLDSRGGIHKVKSQ